MLKPSSAPADDDDTTYEPIPAESTVNKSNLSEMDKSIFEVTGKNLIREGKVAVVLLAGGSASRLGCDGPKGKYNVGLPSQKSLFQILTESFLKAQMIAHDMEADTIDDEEGESFAKVPKEVLTCKMLIMTNMENYEETKKFFRDHHFFGGSEDQFIFFRQAMLPAFTTDGKIMMAGKGKIRLAPNGNGAFFDALGRSAMLQNMLKSLSYVQIVGVDNILNKVLDPVQVGYTASKNLTCSFKSCLKRDSKEKVGVICEKNGSYNVIEYTELPANLASQVAKDG